MVPTSQKSHFLCLAVLLIVGLFVASPLSAASSSRALQEKVEGAIRSERGIQEKAERWAADRTEVLAEIRELKNQKQWLDLQKKKYLSYIEKLNESLAELNRKKKEIEILKTSLEPYLYETVDRLDLSIHQDLPFLMGERTRRLTFLKDSLADYDLGSGEKLRRILEALHVEADYGRNIEKSEAVLEIQGSQTSVYLLRIGRTAVFYVSLDGTKVGRLTPTGEWEPLPSGYASELTRAMEMAERRRAVELVELPLGEVKP